MKKKTMSDTSIARALENLAYDQRNILEAIRILNDSLSMLLRGMSALVANLRDNAHAKENVATHIPQ